MFAYATNGEWNPDCKTPDFLRQHSKLLSDKANVADENTMHKWFEIVSECKCEDKVLRKYTPDTLGEYFVLKEIDKFDPYEFEEWMKYLLNTKQGTDFLNRVFDDFAEISLCKQTLVKILSNLIEIMNSDADNVLVSELVGKFLAKNSMENTEKVRKKLHENFDRIKYVLCWNELYIDKILAIHENRTRSYLSWCYPKLMLFCNSGQINLSKASMLVSKTLITLGELIRYTMADFSSNNTIKIRHELKELINSFYRIKKAANINDHSVREAIILAEGRIFEALNALGAKKRTLPQVVHEFDKLLNVLNADLIAQTDFLLRNDSDYSIWEQFLECMSRIIRSYYRSEKKACSVWLSILASCIRNSSNQSVYWICSTTLVMISITLCVNDCLNASADVEIIYQCLKEIRYKAETAQGNNEDNKGLLEHIDRSVDYFFNPELIDQKYRSQVAAIYYKKPNNVDNNSLDI